MTTMTIGQLNDLDNATCPICKNKSMILCPPEQHLQERNEYGCANCDSPDVPDKVMCPCQD